MQRQNICFSTIPFSIWGHYFRQNDTHTLRLTTFKAGQTWHQYPRYKLKSIMYLEHTTHHQYCSTVPLEVKQALFNGSRMTSCACCMLQKYLDVGYIQIFRNKCFRYASLRQWLIQAWFFSIQSLVSSLEFDVYEFVLFDLDGSSFFFVLSSRGSSFQSAREKT